MVRHNSLSFRNGVLAVDVSMWCRMSVHVVIKDHLKYTEAAS